ncbi:MAG: hypothetical protein J3K34DRAFT_518636 [Monoraphidium minutum]|nr:MAG: hypothetical protein J3K34DRAFT_518636 [Monoraphidium minutum]
MGMAPPVQHPGGGYGGRRRSSLTSAPQSPNVAHKDGRQPGSPASSVWSDDGSEAGGKSRLPGFALPMQSGLLKRISAFRTKEELLDFVAAYHMLLDPINLVTCLYRLAKMSFSQRSRNAYLLELQRSPTFQLLLRSISSQFMAMQLNYMQHGAEPRGVDSRCLANLVWALAKLDLSSDDTALSTEIAVNVAPFVLRSLRGSSPQGLANLLWSYAKLPVCPPEVVAALVGKIGAEIGASLRPGAEDGARFDAQALSNSIWALAHLKARGMELDAFGGAVVAFLEAVATAAARMLARLQQQLLALPRSAGGPHGGPDAGQLLAAAEADFSCQALVNICWALATIAGPVCGTHPPFRALFAVVNAEAIGRLRATAALLRGRQPLPYHGVGGFNEQALSNAVFAFDKAGLLAHDLLAAILDVATLRLQLGGGGGSSGHGHGHGSHDGGAALTFKPQELCTLLKACHTGAAPPWGFLATLLHLLALHPAATDSWSALEKAELQRAYVLFSQHQAAAAQAAHAQALDGAGGLDAGILAQLGLLDAQQQAAAAQQQQQQQQQQQAAIAAALASFEQQAAALQAQQRAAARPPPAALPPFGGSFMGAPFGGRNNAAGGAQSPACAFPLPAPTADGGPFGSSAGTSPRTPLGGAAAGQAPPLPGCLLPGADSSSNKAQRARLAHAPPQQQAVLYAQTQARLAGEGLSTSTAGSLWGGGGRGGGFGGGANDAAAGGSPTPPSAGLPGAGHF